MQVVKEHFKTNGYTADTLVEVEVTHDDDPVVVSAENGIDDWNIQQVL